MDGWIVNGWLNVPGGAQAATQTLQLGQTTVPNLQLLDASLQVVGELGQLLHRPNVLHEDLLLGGSSSRRRRRREINTR